MCEYSRPQVYPCAVSIAESMAVGSEPRGRATASPASRRWGNIHVYSRIFTSQISNAICTTTLLNSAIRNQIWRCITPYSPATMAVHSYGLNIAKQRGSATRLVASGGWVVLVENLYTSPRRLIPFPIESARRITSIPDV